jgi:hypothetical protein
MATTPIDDNFDMPDLTDEMMAEFRPLTELTQTDLHMGVGAVRPLSKPKVDPVDWAGIISNAAVGAGYLAAVWLFVQAWIWVLVS